MHTLHYVLLRVVYITPSQAPLYHLLAHTDSISWYIAIVRTKNHDHKHIDFARLREGSFVGGSVGSLVRAPLPTSSEDSIFYCSYDLSNVVYCIMLYIFFYLHRYVFGVVLLAPWHALACSGSGSYITARWPCILSPNSWPRNENLYDECRTKE